VILIIALGCFVFLCSLVGTKAKEGMMCDWEVEAIVREAHPLSMCCWIEAMRVMARKKVCRIEIYISIKVYGSLITEI